MGLRTASVRRPDAEVMAPALTDAVQAQNFNLPPKSHLEPTTPINSFETKKYSLPNAKKCDPASPLNTDDLSISLDSLDPVNLCLKKRCLGGYLTDLNSASDNFLTQNMSLGLSPMGDREDKMGLQKAGLNVSNISKVKSSSDVDQLFSNNLEANVEDIMQQVIKSIENSDQLNNSSSDFNEVLDLNIDKELLEHVDNMINISMGDHQDDLETEHKIKENQAGVLLTDLQRKHSRIERRLDFLRRRSYKLQAKLMGQHVSGEVVGVFQQVHRSIKKPRDPFDTSKVFGNATPSESMEKQKPLSATSAKLLARKLEMAKVLQANTTARQKNVPKYFGSGSIEASMFRNTTSGQVNIPHWSVEQKQDLQKVSKQLGAQLHIVQDELDSEATESSSGGESCDELQSYNNPHQQYLSIQKRALWKYSSDRAAIAARWTWLQSQISDLEYRIRQHTELHKQIRTTKGAVQLGEVVIRPKPVQSQSEIAGHHDYGVSADPGIGSTAVNGYLGQLPGASGTKLESDMEHQRCARTRPLINFRKRRLLQVAGLHAISKKAARPSTVRCSCIPSRAPCALCTGRVDPTHPRDPPETLGKAEKVALLDSGFHPVLSLSEDTSQTLHLEAIMKMHEWQQRSLKMKTAKVSTKPERLEQRSLEYRTKKLEHRKKYSRLKASTVSALSEKIKKKLRGRKVGRPPGVSKFKKRQTQPTLTQHLQNMDTTTTGSEDAEVEAMIAGGGGGARTPASGSQGRSASFDSPGGSPLLHMQSISGYKQNNRNTRTDSYDIDNIVIPYSVAASTRVEKLQYKEILTPKWRIAEDDIPIEVEVKNNGDLGEDSDVEDLTEDSMVARHDRCEHDEKKRFLSYMKFPLGYGRQRSHKRHDSLAADSSRANSPEPTPLPPTSPQRPNTEDGSATPLAASGSTPLAASGSTPLLMGSPPATPGGATAAAAAEDTPLPSVALMRRRTVSQSRFRELQQVVKEEVGASATTITTTTVDYVEQPPYESRTFPLAEDEYERMVQDMPDAHRGVQTNYRAQDTGDDVPTKAEADSADSESTESAVGDEALIDEEETMMEDEDEEEEDPNDPEWTNAEKSGHRERTRR